ncbi:hypothetical protein [Brevibacterium yomogidense]|uniref:hypothetical protein n=1 Tax=Brevibacterium yomogidense TaxID=946573 RepID=UPI0018DF6211|nr:hypothetical protein [Brevibacterium yomogidense]
MSAGDPYPQIPPMPDRSPEQAHQDQQAGDAASTPESPQTGVGQHGADQHSADQYGPDQHSAGQFNAGQYGAGQFGTDQYGAGRFGAHQADQFGADQYGAHQGDQYGAGQYGAAPAYGPDAAAQSPYAPSADAYGAPAAFSQDAYVAASAPASGDTVPQPAPAPGYAPGDPAPTRQRDGKKTGKSKLPLILSLSAVGVVLVLVVVGALVVMNMNRTQYGPETVAQQYLDAVAAGDLAAAQEVTTATVPNGANEALVSPEIFSGSDSAIEDVQVGEADIDGDVATMTASYTLGGQDYELPLTAEKSGKQGVFFDEWTLQPPVLQTLSLDLTQTADATVNGESVDLATGDTEYAVMPGSYELVVPETKYTEEGSAAISVGFAPDEAPQPAALNVTIGVTDAYKKDVVKAVEAQLDECLESEKLETDCGFFERDSFQSEDEKKTYDKLKKDGVEFDLEKKPEIVVTDFGATSTGSFYTDSDKPGKVVADVETEDGTEYELTSDLHPAGTVEVEGDSIAITFFYNG